MIFFLAQNTPDTIDYMIGGYVAAFVIMGIIVVSIWWRYQSLKKDEVALEVLKEDIAADENLAGGVQQDTMKQDVVQREAVS